MGPEAEARLRIDVYLIRLTATPCKQTFGFFDQSLVMEYSHELAVADGVNVNYDVYCIRTRITEAASKVEAGYAVQIQGRDTRKKRLEQLDDGFSSDASQPDRDMLFTEIFPAHTWVPNTLTYRSTGETAERLIAAFRDSCPPRRTRRWYRSKGARGDGTRRSARVSDEALQIVSNQRAPYGPS